MLVEYIRVNPAGKQLICPIPVGSLISANLSFSHCVPETGELLICTLQSFILPILLHQMCLMHWSVWILPREVLLHFSSKGLPFLSPVFFLNPDHVLGSPSPGVPGSQLFPQEAVAIPVSLFCFLP